jgi:hypothetical protein
LLGEDVHDVPTIGQGEQARAVGDFLAGGAVGIAGTVETLMVAAKPRGVLVAQHPAGDMRSKPSVAFHQLIPGRDQARRLEQQRVRHSQLADIVDQRRLVESESAIGRPTERAWASRLARLATRSEWRSER